MEPDKIYKDISNLPPEARRQVADFISFLKTRYKKQQKTAVRNKIINDPFIGIWKDRKDMKDSSKWLRKVRESEWGGPS
jgi:hypothetical protein